MSEIRVLVGTRKGAFILTSDAKRKDCDLRVPFGGMKASGVGREGGEEALRFFTEPKNVCIAK